MVTVDRNFHPLFGFFDISILLMQVGLLQSRETAS
jgi:hypothetical protein